MLLAVEELREVTHALDLIFLVVQDSIYLSNGGGRGRKGGGLVYYSLALHGAWEHLIFVCLGELAIFAREVDGLVGQRRLEIWGKDGVYRIPTFIYTGVGYICACLALVLTFVV